MNIKTYISIISICLLPFSKVVAQIALQHTTCEMLENPLGIDVQKPRFAWHIISKERNVIQTAYQILVASSAEKLKANEGDIWDSGKVNSSESIHINYNGKPLNSRQKAYWKVKTWTNVGQSEWSANNYFSMGLLYYKDWPKGWIGFDRAFRGIILKQIRVYQPGISGKNFRAPNRSNLPRRRLLV